MDVNLQVLSVAGLIASSLTVLVITPLLQMVLSAVARSQIHRLYDPLCQIITEAEGTRQLLLDRYESEFRQRVLEAKKRHNEEVLRANCVVQTAACGQQATLRTGTASR